MSRSFLLAGLMIGLSITVRPAAGKDFEVVDVPPGATADVYFEVNLGGKVYLNIRSRDGRGCAKLWWIVWPLGSITDLGERCGYVHLEIPGASGFAIASKLRARGGKLPIKIGVAASEQVANSITFSFP